MFNYVLYRLHTGCQWAQVPIDQADDISWRAVYHHFRKWSRDGSLERVWQHSVVAIQDKVDSSVLNLDGSHAVAKKGGEAVAYQGRKKAKTSNILPVTDHNGYIVATTEIVAGNPNDAFDKFRAVLVRFDLKKIYFMGSHFLAFALINLRNVLT